MNIAIDSWLLWSGIQWTIVKVSPLQLNTDEYAWGGKPERIDYFLSLWCLQCGQIKKHYQSNNVHGKCKILNVRIKYLPCNTYSK